MKIVLEPQVMARLLSYAIATSNEYSGFGFCERREDGNIHVYDFVLLNVGSWAYTEIEPRTMLPLLQREDRKKMKVWLHRHPLGNGIPGPHNWSSTDERTIRLEPLGATPQVVNWSVSIVLTPTGFVGRIDNYLKGITEHLEVEPSTKDFFEQVWALEMQYEEPSSTKKRKRKSKGSPDGEFPSPESRTVTRIVGQRRSKKTKTSDTMIPGGTTMMTRQEYERQMGIALSAQAVTLGYMPLSSPSAASSTQPEPPSPTSATLTGSIGSGSADSATNPTDTDNNLS